MVPTLGKRKRRDQLADTNDNGDISTGGVTHDSSSLFRQYFEANFEPLEELKSSSARIEVAEPDDMDTAHSSEWDGLSEGDNQRLEIVYHSRHSPAKTEVPKEELKTFMTAKPPSTANSHASSNRRKPSVSVNTDETPTDAANLKKDLALQRLLRESHLLDSQSSLSHVGQNRHKALDLRLQDMGSKSSVFAQKNMPLAQRKGIMAKSAERDEIRRRQARENGIIIEEAVKSKGKDISKRQRGIGSPTVGKFSGGMLKISKKDVADIEGPKKIPRGRR